MLTKSLQRADQPALTWYLDGTLDRSAERQVVILGPPGMSVRHWAPVIERLRPRCRMLVCDYRGFPSGDSLLSPEQYQFVHLAEDVEAILRAEHIQRADIVSWCAGSWLVKLLHQRNPKLVRSLVAIGVGRGNENVLSEFEATIREIQQMVAADPPSMGRILLRMRRLGLIRDEAYYQAIYERSDADPAPTRPLSQMLGEVGRSLPFSFFGAAIPFQNYLALFKSFQDNFCRVDDMAVPLTLISGRHVKAAGPERADASRRERLSDTVWLLSLEQLSEFLLLEHPAAIAEEIETHWRERCTPRSAVAPRPSSPAESAAGAEVGDVA
jgi:pimeloyl-ACP methyl ester carboxylesterase